MTILSGHNFSPCLFQKLFIFIGLTSLNLFIVSMTYIKILISIKFIIKLISQPRWFSSNTELQTRKTSRCPIPSASHCTGRIMFLTDIQYKNKASSIISSREHVKCLLYRHLKKYSTNLDISSVRSYCETALHFWKGILTKFR